MFRHVVLFRWTEDATEEHKRTLEERLAALPGAIPEIKDYHFGADAGVNDGNYDFAVVADFADLASFVTYRDHPAHRAVVDECIRPIMATRAAAQYAF
ncbi:MAG TPA: Dabb family protein [Streptosporangiaceae bacterium]|nr:Dabb family protein [Streptosporangiaceae bacterium]